MVKKLMRYYLNVINKIRLEPIYGLIKFKKGFINYINRGVTRFSNGYTLSMNTLSILPIYKCNLDCVMCGVNKNDEDELQPELIKKVINEVKIYNPNVILTGGEPLLYKHWYDIAKFIKLERLRLDLQTNGILLEENAYKIIDTIDNLNISIDGTDKIHDKIRGKKDCFNKIIKGIKYIDELKNKNRLFKPYLGIIYTISDLNYDNIYETFEFLIGLNIKLDFILFLHLMYMDKEELDEIEKNFELKVSNLIKGYTYQPKNIDIEELNNQLRKVKDKNIKNSEVMFHPKLNKENLERYYKDDKFPEVAPNKCLTPYFDTFILPNGDVWNCPLSIIGNIKEDSIRNIWNNTSARALRNIINRIGKFKVCKNCCGLYTY